jgi:hypothetical protein
MRFIRPWSLVRISEFTAKRNIPPTGICQNLWKDNRLRVFARTPAPIQVSWLGYPGSAGVETIDHWLTDRFLSPPESDLLENANGPIRLPDAWCCYPAPETANGPVEGLFLIPPQAHFHRRGQIFHPFNHSKDLVSAG